MYFVSDYFKYYAIAIGSMKSVFNKGSAVIVQQIKKDHNMINIGDIIAYRMNNNIVVLRVINIKTIANEIYFYTKGKVNSYKDNYKIPKENIIGRVKIKIPYVGYSSVRLSEL